MALTVARDITVITVVPEHALIYDLMKTGIFYTFKHDLVFLKLTSTYFSALMTVVYCIHTTLWNAVILQLPRIPLILFIFCHLY